MKYELILFDVDNTLIDFEYSEKKALEKIFAINGVTLTDEILAFYAKKNKELWKRLEKGEVTKKYVLEKRFEITFEKFRIDVDVSQINHRYQIELGENVLLFDGAYELCEKLLNICQVAIVTNGTKIAQDRKLKISGFDKIIEHIFISEVIGFNKPDKRFFEHVFDVIGEIPKEKILIVGDSLTSDIRGGNNVGIDTCWFNPDENKNYIEKSTYEISRLMDLLEVID